MGFCKICWRPSCDLKTTYEKTNDDHSRLFMAGAARIHKLVSGS